MGNIVHASIGENGTTNNKPGDQTGKEVCVRSWYDKGWKYMLRYKDKSIAQKVAENAKKIANCSLVGYDQGDRNTLYKQLKKCNFDVDKYIKSGVKTETDCSAFVYAMYACAIPSIRSDGNAPTTSTMKSFYTANGFKVYTATKYLRSKDSLINGDILLIPGSHTVMSCDNASEAETTTAKVRVTCASLNCRMGAGTNYDVICTVHKGDEFSVIAEKNGWVRISKGWISAKYCERV